MKFLINNKQVVNTILLLGITNESVRFDGYEVDENGKPKGSPAKSETKFCERMLVNNIQYDTGEEEIQLIEGGIVREKYVFEVSEELTSTGKIAIVSYIL